MKTHAIFTGSELLNGQTLNGNLITLGQIWSEQGWKLESSSTIPDDISLIKKALVNSLESNELTIICGGLGATSDDIWHCQQVHTDCVFAVYIVQIATVVAVYKQTA